MKISFGIIGKKQVNHNINCASVTEAKEWITRTYQKFLNRIIDLKINDEPASLTEN